jgi:phospholipase/lecithinase/hemolysin
MSGGLVLLRFSLVQIGVIESEILAANSVALVAISGHDFDRVAADLTPFADLFCLLVERVTDKIVATVVRLQEIGIQRVIVNNLYPLGCGPSISRRTIYSSCDELSSEAAELHNRRLTRKLAHMEERVLILDIAFAFNDILKHHADGGGEIAQDFVHKITPCCESMGTGGYCGQIEQAPTAETVELFKICDDPEEFFYWDDMNPTQAGWAAVMAKLESAIKEFVKE